MNQVLLKDVSPEEVRRIVNEHLPLKVFLVTGKKSYTESGAQSFIENTLSGLPYERFYNFESNPRYEDVIDGVKIFTQSKCNLVIAIGGGSVIDMVKLINIISANNDADPLNLVQNSSLITKKGAVLIAIPTTSGTGSEATHFTVVYFKKKKYSVVHEFVLPDYAGLNYQLQESQPRYLSACTGLDALSQAIASYWSVGSTEESKKYALEAIKLLVQNLKESVMSSTKRTRELVMIAAYLAGKAINISKTTAPHAISYAFTTYFSIPHGQAVFFTLPVFLKYNYNVTEVDLNDPRGVEYVKSNIIELCEILNADGPENACSKLKILAKDIGVELSLSELDIVGYEETIVSNINMERMSNNPRKISSEQLIQLLKE